MSNGERHLISEGILNHHREGPADTAHVAISRLPLELLQYIFLFSVPTIYDKALILKLTPPLSLCHVCSLWRTAAFGLSRLWNSLGLHFSCRGYNTHHKSITQLLQFWLDRAKASPTTLSLGFPSINVSITADPSADVNSILMPHSNHLVELALLNAPYHFLEEFYSRGHVDRLEHLIIDDDSNTNFAHSHTLTAFEKAPCLHRVAIRNIDINWFNAGGPRLRLPWGKLTHLKIDIALPLTLWRALLLKCTLLERCSFKLDYRLKETIVDNGAHKHILPHLIDMSIVAYGHREKPLGIRDFRFPALTEFQVTYASINTAWIHTSRQTIQFRSLRRFSLHHCRISFDNLLVIFRAMPLLKELSLSLNTEMSSMVVLPEISLLWKALGIADTWRDASQNLLAKLEVLHLWLSVDARGSFVPLECSNMIKSRCTTSDNVISPKTLLRFASLHLYKIRGDIVNEIGDLLEPYRRKGLVVNVDGMYSPINEWE